MIKSISESDVKDSLSFRLAHSARSSPFLKSLNSDSNVDLMTYKKGELGHHHQHLFLRTPLDGSFVESKIQKNLIQTNIKDMLLAVMAIN